MANAPGSKKHEGGIMNDQAAGLQSAPNRSLCPWPSRSLLEVFWLLLRRHLSGALRSRDFLVWTRPDPSLLAGKPPSRQRVEHGVGTILVGPTIWSLARQRRTIGLRTMLGGSIRP
ncbi:hypothetical protein CIHG_04564 [Coccidioides immitis H538.4]|uniref:Uncharacterized protein n=3 Tax=Coccidioides immitis TaxID=5501 RepID=A0A0J8TYC9_COCIT|nr:hypothetical protein CIRG_06731 [Coccidioides immitis RMSCC 2394]KMU78982.1 hypothetical protein CISG_07625 [Coccidioides immitis RMSCC 3703]KMU86775.1 hypothetical protein CIHG_04564 [Coccidioides immitis H538.4]